MTTRFTIDGSNGLEDRLKQICVEVLSGVQKIVPGRKLQAVALGGGYGRGEGGVLKSAQGDLPYNDLEFYVFLRGIHFLNERKYRDNFHHLAEELSAEAGVEVEFKLTSAKKFQRNPSTMFFYDLTMGHRLLLGDDSFFAQSRHRDAEKIPISEAIRLLMNRCSGLLFAQERLSRERFTPEDADFVARNQAKAQLGFGDTMLTALGQYHWSCRERKKRLEKIANNFSFPFPLSQIHCHHTLGTDFKLHPQKKTGPKEAFYSLQTELGNLGRQLWLWLEDQRLKHHFASAKDYALSSLDKCPETNPLRNRLINARVFGPAIMIKKIAARYPRERLLNSLALLLWEPSALHEANLLNKLQSDLKTEAATFAGLVEAYRSLWRHFN